MRDHPIETEECPACGGAEVSIEQRLVSSTSKGPSPSFLEEYSRCATCGEVFYTHKQSMASSRASAAAIRKAEGLLAPEEILQARLGLGMRQVEFEQALGVGKKSATRWENGTVPPSKGVNFALWTALHYPDVFLAYARTRVPEAAIFKVRDAAIVAEIGQALTENGPALVKRFNSDSETGSNSNSGIVETRISGVGSAP